MSQFVNLVFEGGGVKGIAYAGALEILEQQNVMPDIRRVAGTSAGAITAVLVALGARSQDVAAIVGSTHFRAFMDDSFTIVGDIDRLIHEYGWYKGDAFADWMRKQIHVLCGNSELTFAQLAAKAQTAGSACRDLYIIGTNLSLQMPTVYSADTTPDTPIWQAARISMSIPLFFASVMQAKQVLVDGGVTWNYPLDLFDDRKYVAPGSPWEPPLVDYPTAYDANHIFNKQTLGFRVDTQDEIKAEKESWGLPPQKIDNFVDYLRALVGFMNDMANKMHLHTNDWHRTVAIDAGGVSATDFDLSDAQVQLLIGNGRTGTTNYFNWFNDPASAPPPINRI
ncbi:MAG: patatin-like phospholipase family protein [Opitutae bacterium]|nr:patatin-like phospholipase family protein [Opitutae bacterium]